MENQILVYYFIRNYSIRTISSLVEFNEWKIKEIINEWLKPTLGDKFIILECKMNAPDE